MRAINQILTLNTPHPNPPTRRAFTTAFSGKEDTQLFLTISKAFARPGYVRFGHGNKKQKLRPFAPAVQLR